MARDFSKNLNNSASQAKLKYSEDQDSKDTGQSTENQDDIKEQQQKEIGDEHLPKKKSAMTTRFRRKSSVSFFF